MPEEIQDRIIEDEMKEAYIDYAMSVIVGRALPDVRDGLKPVQRRILYTMWELGLSHNKPFKKSANIVGNCMAKFHPHGDLAIYEALVRLAQPFSLRYPLINGQGNFGSLDGDAAAAQRYTEVRLMKIAEEMLSDIEKNTVDFIPNFDNSTKEPIVLPSKIPNLLINGATGIAVGMATSIPPHNISEIINGLLKLIEKPDIEIEELIKYIKGPDFPTGGIILGKSGIINAYKTGKGHIALRGKAEIQGNKIIITEIPYMVNKSALVETIAKLAIEKTVHGISNVRDESDKEGLRIVIECKHEPNLILNQLYKHTQLQTTFGISMLALYNNQPKIMNLKDMLTHFIDFRKNIVKRRTKFELEQAEEQAHILEGFKIVLSNLDEIIALIRKSDEPAIAKKKLIANYNLTDKQVNAILDMRLHRLTRLERTKIIDEHKHLLEAIKDYNNILNSEERVKDIVKNELLEISKEYGDKRKTSIIEEFEELAEEDLIPEENVLITITRDGYAKRISLIEYKAQKRAGKGIIGTETKEGDIVEQVFTTSTHNYLLFFTNQGRMYWLKAYQIPKASRYSMGKALVNLLNLQEQEKVTTTIPITMFDDQHYLIMSTKKGIIKKVRLSDFSSLRKGIIAIKLLEGDELVSVKVTPGWLKFILCTRNGYALKFDEQDVRVMGRNAVGVRGIRLRKGDAVIGMEVALETGSLLTITEGGYGKRTAITDYRLQTRGGKGIINIKVNQKKGLVTSVKTVKDDDEIIVITSKGMIIRLNVNEIPSHGRNTQGVRIIKLAESDKVTRVTRINKNNR